VARARQSYIIPASHTSSHTPQALRIPSSQAYAVQTYNHADLGRAIRPHDSAREKDRRSPCRCHPVETKIPGTSNRYCHKVAGTCSCPGTKDRRVAWTVGGCAGWCGGVMRSGLFRGLEISFGHVQFRRVYFNILIFFSFLLRFGDAEVVSRHN